MQAKNINDSHKILSQWSKRLISPTPFPFLDQWIEQNKQIIIDHNLLLHAVMSNRKDIVFAMLDAGIDIETSDSLGRTALHHAAIKGDRFDILELLLSKKAKQRQDERGNTPLHYAISEANMNAISALISIDDALMLSVRNNQQETLIQLAQKSEVRKEILTLLFEDRANSIDIDEVIAVIEKFSIDEPGISHAAFLHLIAHGEFEDIKKLANAQNVNYVDSEKTTATVVAAEKGRQDVLDWLVQTWRLTLTPDAVCAAVCNGRIEMLKHLTKPVNEGGYGLSLKFTNMDGISPVSMAVKNGQIEMLHLLLKPVNEGGYGLALDTKNNNDHHPIFFAIAYKEIEMLKILLKPVNEGGYGLSLEVKDLGGRDPVLTAVAYGQIEILHLLLKPVNEGGYGMSLNTRDKNGKDPVLAAVIFGHIEILKALLKPIREGGYGLSLNNKDKYGKDPILLTMVFGKIDMLQLLLKPINEGGYGLSLNVRDKSNRGPVLVAVSNGGIKMLQLLLKPIDEGGYGLSLNVKDNSNSGPVLLAVANKQLEMLKLLIKPINEGGYGLSLDTEDRWGRDPILIAVLRNQAESLDYLLKPVSEGGCGLLLRDVEKALAEANSTLIFTKLFFHHFSSLLQENSEAAIDWAQKNYNHEKFDVKPSLITRYQELIKFYFETLDSADNEQYSILEQLVEALKAVSFSEANFFLAKLYAQAFCHEESYKYYLQIFENGDEGSKKKAAYELVELILNGYVTLNSNGELDEHQTKNTTLEDIEKMSKNLDIMQTRAIMAYEYLADDLSNDANDLRKRLNNILSGNLLLGSHFALNQWSAQILKQYMLYFVSKKKLHLLGENSYVKSLTSNLDNQPDQKNVSETDEKILTIQKEENEEQIQETNQPILSEVSSDVKADDSTEQLSNTAPIEETTTIEKDIESLSTSIDSEVEISTTADNAIDVVNNDSSNNATASEFLKNDSEEIDKPEDGSNNQDITMLEVSDSSVTTQQQNCELDQNPFTTNDEDEDDEEEEEEEENNNNNSLIQLFEVNNKPLEIKPDEQSASSKAQSYLEKLKDEITEPEKKWLVRRAAPFSKEISKKIPQGVELILKEINKAAEAEQPQWETALQNVQKIAHYRSNNYSAFWMLFFGQNLETKNWYKKVEREIQEEIGSKQIDI